MSGEHRSSAAQRQARQNAKAERRRQKILERQQRAAERKANKPKEAPP